MVQGNGVKAKKPEGREVLPEVCRHIFMNPGMIGRIHDRILTPAGICTCPDQECSRVPAPRGMLPDVPNQDALPGILRDIKAVRGGEDFSIGEHPCNT
jgi:hypothetical protein